MLLNHHAAYKVHLFFLYADIFSFIRTPEGHAFCVKNSRLRLEVFTSLI